MSDAIDDKTLIVFDDTDVTSKELSSARDTWSDKTKAMISATTDFISSLPGRGSAVALVPLSCLVSYGLSSVSAPTRMTGLVTFAQCGRFGDMILTNPGTTGDGIIEYAGGRTAGMAANVLAAYAAQQCGIPAEARVPIAFLAESIVANAPGPETIKDAVVSAVQTCLDSLSKGDDGAEKEKEKAE